MAAHCEHLLPADVGLGVGCWYATRNQGADDDDAEDVRAVQWLVMCDECNERISQKGSAGELVVVPVRLERALFFGGLN